MSTHIANRQTLCTVSPRLRGRTVLSAGDVRLPVSLEGGSGHISPETMVCVANITHEGCRLGGAQ